MNATANTLPLELALHQVIHQVHEAKAFIRALNAAGKMFHFDDSPETIVSCRTGERIFTDEECLHVRRRVAEIFSFEGFCPFEYALELP